MKAKFSLSAILGATALTTGILFALPAVSCPFQKVKDMGMKFNNPLNPMQIGLLGVGGAATLAGAGLLVAKKLNKTTDTSESISDELVMETSFPIYVPAEALETSNLVMDNEEVSSKEHTSIG